MSISSGTSLVLDLPPSCIEVSVAHPDYFLVGTYNLVKEGPGNEDTAEASVSNDEPPAKKTQYRNGSLIVFKVKGRSM
jgi:diphthine methyl ester acylhydrolase